MPKHELCDFIVAKAANVDLVVFEKVNGGVWKKLSSYFPEWFHDCEYFLCLPKFEKECLHWLNGGEVEENYNGEWSDVEPHVWYDQSVFMWDDGYKIRIKPETKKMWIGYFPDTNQTFPHPQDTQDLAENYAAMHYKYPVDEWQFIEIEVKKKPR